MDIKRAIPAFILGALGFISTVFGIFLFLSGSTEVLGLKGQFVVIVGGLLLVAFAIFYARNENEYKDEEDAVHDEVEIIWEEADEAESEKDQGAEESGENEVLETETGKNESSGERK